MYRAYKFRLYPNKEQQELINKTFGCNRFIYNYYLSKMKEFGYQGTYSNINDYVNNLKYEYQFLQEVDSIVIRKSLFNLDNAYKKLFNKDGGYPKYKSKFSKNSYNTQAIYSKYKDKINCNIELDLINKLIKLPKLKWVKVKGFRNYSYIDGRIKNTTISRESNGKYYVSVMYEVNDYYVKEIISRNIVGIDLGIKKLLTLSDFTTYENNKYIEIYEKRIKRVQKELSRKVKRSNNYYKCKKRLSVLYSKLSNARKYYIHKITKKLTDEYDLIIGEKLSSKKMIINGSKNHLSKKINDACFNEIIRQLQYKSKWKGKQFYQIDTYYPSSQICSVCGNKDDKYKDLSKREYNCSKCNNKIDRDINASINIMLKGYDMYLNRVYG